METDFFYDFRLAIIVQLWVNAVGLSRVVIVFEGGDDTHLLFLEFVDLECGAAELFGIVTIFLGR